MGTLESVSAQQRQQRSIITPHQLNNNNNNNVNQNLPSTGTGNSRVRSNSRSSCNVGPYFALLMMASLIQTSVAAGSFEGRPGSNTPARPPTAAAAAAAAAAAGAAAESHHRNSNGGGGGGGERQQPPPGALSPAMYTRVSDKETDVRRAGMGAETGPGGGAWGREGESHGGREGGGGGGGRGEGGVFGRDGGGDGHRDGRAGQRQQAFLAAGRSSGRAAALVQRAGAGADGGRGGGGQEEQQALFLQQQLRRRQEAEQMARGEPWDATATGYGTAAQGAEGAGSAEGVRGPVGAGAGPAPPASPANTPLQEQVYQTQYRHQHNQIPGQAIGTQQRSSSLFRRAGSGGVFFIFVILVCRSLNSYEHADQLDGVFRGLMMAPAVALFLGNLVCMCLSLVQSATTKQKARMKTMLTIDAAAEGVLLVYNLLCLLRGSGYIPREEFVSRMLGNVLFLSLCFTFAKARWVADGAY